ncbi:MAG: hypothetical protein GF317_21590|nr:hypothetical protein [Candidatus Lokiarchaeota archaeon]MBD3202056.1 hypothetical protein [Candidatus Lokiarchaeota archaeon]
MPKGVFCLLLPFDTDYKVLGYYLIDNEVSDFEITSNLFLRLNLDHERNEYNYLKLKLLRIFSYIHRFTGKKAQKASGYILGILMSEDEKAEKYRSSLKEAAEEIGELDLLKIDSEDFESHLRRIYQETLEPLIDILDPEKLKQHIIDRTKTLLSGGRKERQLAQDLLEEVEDDEHLKITDYYKTAKKSLKQGDFEKAAKNFIRASEISEELLGDSEITKSLKERSTFAQKIPNLSKKREKIVEDARSALRNENFHEAYLLYRKASEISKELIDFDKEEEYRLKSKALNDFYQVDQRFKKES